MGQWADLAEQLRKRDEQHVSDINGFFGGGLTIENRIALADGRASDALTAIMKVLLWLDEKEQSEKKIEP